MTNHSMRTLLNDDFAPATSEVGFIKAPLDRVATAALDWRLSLAADTSTVGHDSLDGDLPVLLNRLAPLSVARHARELFVATDSQWTAYFDSGHRGTDSAAPSHLARALGVQFVWVSCVPHVPERYGSVSCGSRDQKGPALFERSDRSPLSMTAGGGRGRRSESSSRSNHPSTTQLAGSATGSRRSCWTHTASLLGFATSTRHSTGPTPP